MKKIEFLKLAVSQRCYRKLAWIMSAFALVKEGPEDYRKDPYTGRIVQDPAGFRFCKTSQDGSVVLEPIEDAVAGQPIFKMSDRITVDEEYGINAKHSIETSIGTMLTNAILLYEVFGHKFAYVAGKISVDKLEDKIALLFRDPPEEGQEKDPAYVYADEYIKFVDNVQYMSAFSQVCVYSATRKNMVTAPGFREFKAQLDIKYQGKLHDPVVLTQYEKELADYDENWVRDDPTNGILMSGRVKANARRKMFLSVGSGMNVFSNSLEVTPVTSSLEDGWPTDPTLFSAMLSSARSGSFSRGAETQKGGTSAKVLLRATSNYVIKDEDCGSQVGIVRTFNNGTVNQLVGRTVQTSGGWKLVDTKEEAAPLLNKPLIVRSPMYCHAEGDVLCRVCAGEKLMQNPNGLSTPVTEVSAIILNTAMKAMHGKVLSTAHLDIETAFS